MSKPSGPEYVLQNVECPTLSDGLVFVLSSDLVSKAITQMVAFEYSQMPVFTGTQQETTEPAILPYF